MTVKVIQHLNYSLWWKSWDAQEFLTSFEGDRWKLCCIKQPSSSLHIWLSGCPSVIYEENPFVSTAANLNEICWWKGSSCSRRRSHSLWHKHKSILCVSKPWRCISLNVNSNVKFNHFTSSNYSKIWRFSTSCHKHPSVNVWLVNIRRAHPAARSRYAEQTERKGLLILWFTLLDYITMTDRQTRINDNNVCFPCVQMNARLSRPCLKHLCAAAYYIPIVTQRSLRLFVCTQLWK